MVSIFYIFFLYTYKWSRVRKAVIIFNRRTGDNGRPTNNEICRGRFAPKKIIFRSVPFSRGSWSTSSLGRSWLWPGRATTSSLSAARCLASPTRRTRLRALSAATSASGPAATSSTAATAQTTGPARSASGLTRMSWSSGSHAALPGYMMIEGVD